VDVFAGSTIDATIGQTTARKWRCAPIGAFHTPVPRARTPASPETMRFLVIDDHPMMRDAITAALHSVDPGFTVHGASTLAEGFRTIDASDPFDLLFLDLGLPGMQGLQSLEEVRLSFDGVTTGDHEHRRKQHCYRSFHFSDSCLSCRPGRRER
jgi:hypothetical protein